MSIKNDTILLHRKFAVKRVVSPTEAYVAVCEWVYELNNETLTIYI